MFKKTDGIEKKYFNVSISVPNTDSELAVRQSTPEKDYFYVDHVLDEHILPLTNVAFNKLGTRFLTGSYDNSAKLWETDTGAVAAHLRGHSGVVFSVAFNNPYADKALTGSFDQTARLWDAHSAQCLHIWDEHTAEVVRQRRLRMGRRRGEGWQVCGGFSPSGEEAVTGSMDSRACLWDVESGSLLATLGRQPYRRIYVPTYLLGVGTMKKGA